MVGQLVGRMVRMTAVHWVRRWELKSVGPSAHSKAEWMAGKKAGLLAAPRVFPRAGSRAARKDRYLAAKTAVGKVGWTAGQRAAQRDAKTAAQRASQTAGNWAYRWAGKWGTPKAAQMDVR